MSVKRLYNRRIFLPWKMALAYRLSRPKRGAIPLRGKRILLCNTGGLGDVFILTQMLPRLVNCEVGFLVTKEGRMAVEGCPGVDRVHLIEPWYCSSDSKWKKWRKWRAFCGKVEEKRREFAQYDSVFFSNPHFCGLTRLFPDAYTVGFDTHADCSHFSQVIPWNPDIYLAAIYQGVLDALEIAPGPLSSPWSQLVDEPLISGEYCVMHIGASTHAKEYSSEMWKQVYRGLKAKRHQIVFTGKGQRQLIDAITSNSEENLSDQLSWLEFLRVIAHSQLVISVDTVALHVAAAFKRSLIALYRDAPDQATWRPQ